MMVIFQKYFFGLFLLFTISFQESSLKKAAQTREQLEISCVICKFVIQQTDKHIDVSRECPVLNELELKKMQKQLMTRNPLFIQNFSLLHELQENQRKILNETYQNSDDNYYYVIHPNHIDNYLDLIENLDKKDKENENEPSQEKEKKQYNQNKAQIIYHEQTSNQQNMPHEILIQHQYQFKDQQNNNNDQQQQTSFLELKSQKLRQKKSFLQTKEINFSDVEIKPSEFIVRRDMPFQVDQRKLDRIFKDKTPGFRYNQGPFTNLQPSKPNKFSGNFIIDKNINQGLFEPQSLLVPSDQYEPYTQNTFVGKSVKRPEMFAQNIVSQQRKIDNPTSFFQIELPLDFNSAGNNITPNYESLLIYLGPYKRALNPVVNTDSNIFELANNDTHYIGYGKALFPPSADAIQPANKCCTSYPCVSQEPCPLSDIMNVIMVQQTQIQGIRFPQMVMRKKAEQAWFRFRQNNKKKFKSQRKKANSNQAISFLQLRFLKKIDTKSGRQQRFILQFQKRKWKIGCNMGLHAQEYIEFDPFYLRIRGEFLSQVAKSYIPICIQLLEKIDLLTESWLYQDNTQQMCEAVSMCPT